MDEQAKQNDGRWVFWLIVIGTLSAPFCWFALRDLKLLTPLFQFGVLLIAAMIVVGIPIIVVAWIATRKRFTLRTLFVAILAFAVSFAFHAWANSSGFYYAFIDPVGYAAENYPGKYFRYP
jgi:hypothetical protein